MFKKKRTGRNRRVGPADRRKYQQKPEERTPGVGWAVAPEHYCKRKDSVTNEISYSKDERIRIRGRRKTDKKT